MHLIDFISEFPDEESCKQKFKAYRDQVWRYLQRKSRGNSFLGLYCYQQYQAAIDQYISRDKT